MRKKTQTIAKRVLAHKRLNPLANGKQIAQDLGISPAQVYNVMYLMRKNGVPVSARKAAAPKEMTFNELLQQLSPPPKFLEEQPEPKPGPEPKVDALGEQVGGNHYASLAIQPIEYISKNGLGYFEGNVVKYVTRHRDKNGAEDIRKAMHYCRLLLKLEYNIDA